jgi:polysaccharide biosynthesis PFTS motif protein
VSRKNRKLVHKRDSFKGFVDRGDLSILRSVLGSVIRENQNRVFKLFPDGEKRDIRIYLQQLYFDELFGRNFVERLSTGSKSRKKVSVALPRENYLPLREHFLGLKFRRDFIGMLSWRTKKSLRSLFVILQLLRSCIGRNSEKIDLSNTLFVIGHIHERLHQSHANSDQYVHNYYNWREKKGLKRCNIEFVSERKFFQILINNSKGIREVKSIYKTLKNISLRILKLDLKLREVIIVLDQVFMEEIFKSCNFERNKLNIVYTESSLSKRPFWTYEVERQKTKVGLAFFSGFSSLVVKGQTEFPLEASLYSWKYYQVISKWQQDMIKQSVRLRGEVQIENMGVPWFRDSKYVLPNFNEPILAVFDYQPHVNYFGISTLNDLGLSQVDAVVEFLETIMDLCNVHKIRFLHKPKRNISLSLSMPEYVETLKFLATNSLYLRIPEETAPSRLIEKAHAVISLPPTTPGILASEMGVPSVFFDPTNRVDSLDPALSGVSVVGSAEALEKWILEKLSR